MQDAKFFLKNVVPKVTNKKKRAVMRNLILDNLHLSHGQFKTRVLAKIDEMLVEINRWKKENKGKQ